MGHKAEPGKINETTWLIDGNMVGVPRILSLYVVKGEKAALIDGGTSHFANTVIEALKNFGLYPVDYIIPTHEHWDHIQGVAPLLKDMGEDRVEVLASEVAAPFIEDPSKIEYDFGMGPIEGVKKVTPLKEGDVIDLGGGVELEVFHVPGHAPGHIALLERKTKTLFVGDAVGNKVDATTFLPVFNPPWFDKETYLASLDKMEKIDFNSICLGHFGCWDGDDAKNIISEAREVFHKFWKFFEENVDKLDDIDYLANTALERYLKDSEVIKRVGMDFAKVVITWLRDGFKKYKKIT
ncbi:MAG: MBL fold metallo-hydrolase [Candidatus Freyarchaeota archaeon]